MEGVFGQVLVIEEVPANAEHHRPVPHHQCREGRLAASVPPSVESLQELAVGESDHGTLLEERPDLLGHGPDF